MLRLKNPSGTLLMESDANFATHSEFEDFAPRSSPLLRGGNADVYYVVSQNGTYSLEVVPGASLNYELTLTARRPYLETLPSGTKQLLYLDFNGESNWDSSVLKDEFPTNQSNGGFDEFLDHLIANPDQNELGVTPQNKESVKNGIIDAVVDEMTSLFAPFQLSIFNSRDHGDGVWGQPYVSRVIFGFQAQGINVSGGVSESDDFGNFTLEETAYVVLDSVPFFIDDLTWQTQADGIDLTGRYLGRIAAHEAGHLFGLLHSDVDDDLGGGENAQTMDSGADTWRLMGFPNPMNNGQPWVWDSDPHAAVAFGADAIDSADYYNPPGQGGISGTQDSVAVLSRVLILGQRSTPLTPSVRVDVVAALGSISAGDGSTINFTATAPAGKYVRLYVNGQVKRQHQLLPFETQHTFSLVVCGRTPQSDAPTGGCTDWTGTVAGQTVTITYADSSTAPESAPSAPLMVGDFNHNGTIEAADIDLLIDHIFNDWMNEEMDLNDDDDVTLLDLEILVNLVLRTYFGDANLNGIFNSGDLVLAFQAGEYEDTPLDNSTWAEGDWNADKDFDSGDLVDAFQDGGYVDE